MRSREFEWVDRDSKHGMERYAVLNQMVGCKTNHHPGPMAGFGINNWNTAASTQNRHVDFRKEKLSFKCSC